MKVINLNDRHDEKRELSRPELLVKLFVFWLFSDGTVVQSQPQAAGAAAALWAEQDSVRSASWWERDAARRGQGEGGRDQGGDRGAQGATRRRFAGENCPAFL